MEYQLMAQADIPEHIWESALIVDGETHHHRMDLIWHYLKALRNPNGALVYEKLATVALLVLTLPYSNAEEEQVFSMVTKNKTKFRPNLKLDGTLSSILTIKLAKTEPCHMYEPTSEILETAKKVTMEYNRAHSKK